MHASLPVALLAALLLAACDLPKDNAGTLDRVRGGELRVGVAEHPPWVRLDGERVGGIEPALIRTWAARLGATVRWVRGAETALVEALDRREIDLLVAGLPRSTPFASRVGLTQPYLETELRLAMPPDRPVPGDWAGQRVAVAPDRPEVAARLREEGLEPVPAAADAAVLAGYDVEIDAGRYRLVGPVLAREQRAMAVSAGESAFLLALDRFLAETGEDGIRRLAAAEAAP